MAYENIDVNKLKTALSTINNINNSKIDSLVQKMDSEQWQSPVRSRLQTALSNISKQYASLKKDIDTYKEIANHIEKYNRAKSDYDRLNDDVNYYNNKLNSLDENSSFYEYNKSYFKSKLDNNVLARNNARASMNEIEKKINL